MPVTGLSHRAPTGPPAEGRRRGAGVGKNWAMPFPPLTFAQSLGIAVPISLAGYAAQEFYIRRRAVKRRLEDADGAVPGAADAGDTGPRVTVGDPAAEVKAAAKPVAASSKPVKAAPKPVKAASRPVTAAPKPVKATPKAAPKPAPARQPSTRKPAPVALEELQRRQAALRQALDAVITFVDAPPRRAGATACADAVLRLVPRDERGPNLDAFLDAAGAKEAPGRLQDLAEESGVEMATAIKALNTEIRARQ